MAVRQGRPGLEEVARRAGVGLSTVDRVLNERGSVSPATERRVIEAARALGLRRLLPTPHGRQVRIEVIFAQQPAVPFWTRLAGALAQVAGTLDSRVTVQRTALDMRDPLAVAPRILASRADGIIVYCEEHPANVAAIGAAREAGRPVICFVTDVPGSSRLAYVGIDHSKAGRAAGLLIGRMARAAGHALVISTSVGFSAHRQRIDGFTAALAIHNPEIAVLSGLTSGDDEERVYHHVAHALGDRGRRPVAVYNTGGGSAGAALAIRDRGGGEPILFAGHELTDETRALLQAGEMTLVIDQAPELQARRAIDLMLDRLGITAGQAIGSEIAFTLHTAENC